MMTKLPSPEGDAFGTRSDWSTWTGAEIGTRIVHFLRSKMDNAFSDTLPSTPSNQKIFAYFAKNLSCTEMLDQIERYQTPLITSHTATSIVSDDRSDSKRENQDKVDSQLSPKRNSYENMIEFYCYSEPPITLFDYVKRLIHYTRIAISPVNLAVALLYLERIEKNGACEVNQFTIFRLFAVAYLVAYKFMDDPPVMKNLEFSKIAGISLSEINRLEICFLNAINFELGVGYDLPVAQKITRILVPPKVSPAILLGRVGDLSISVLIFFSSFTFKSCLSHHDSHLYFSDLIGISTSQSTKALIDTNRWTPDSVVIDCEDDDNIGYEDDNYGYFFEDDCEDVFDRSSVYENYSGIVNNRGVTFTDVEDNFESNFRENLSHHYRLNEYNNGGGRCEGDFGCVIGRKK